jgi:hypothetical protein
MFPKLNAILSNKTIYEVDVTNSLILDGEAGVKEDK